MNDKEISRQVTDTYEGWGALSHGKYIFPSHLNNDIKNVHQLVWHLQYVDTAVEGSEFYCYNTEGDRNSVVSQTSCRINVTQLEQSAYIKIAVMQGRTSVQKGIVPHGFHKFSVAFSSICPLKCSYFDVSIHSA